MEELKKMELCAIWLIKRLCLETNAEKAELTQDITHEGKPIGTYRITIEKVSPLTTT
jgi:hypothetical protein